MAATEWKERSEDAARGAAAARGQLAPPAGQTGGNSALQWSRFDKVEVSGQVVEPRVSRSHLGANIY